TQIVLFSILTLILTAVTVWGGRTWLRNSETLVFAVGEANGPEARFAAKLAILRTDAKVPSRARAVAILDHDVLLLLSPGDKKIKAIADLKKKKIAVMADSEKSAALVRNILE